MSRWKFISISVILGGLILGLTYFCTNQTKTLNASEFKKYRCTKLNYKKLGWYEACCLTSTGLTHVCWLGEQRSRIKITSGVFRKLEKMK